MATIQLNSGYDIPVVGLGTWRSENGKVAEAVKFGIDVGYRHIDCAYYYENEEEIGEGITAKIADRTIKREDLFVTSKLWNTFHDPDDVRKGFKESFDRLNLKYLDLYLMHWPVALREYEPLISDKANESILFPDHDFVATYKAMEKLVDEGLVRSLGISNFNITQLRRLLGDCRIKPAVHQIEVHPYLNNQTLIDFTQEQGIMVTAYSPFCSPDRPWAKEGELRLLDDPRVLDIAGRLSRTPAQVLLRYATQRGLTVVAKSVTPIRIKENFKVEKFDLQPKDKEMLDSMDKGFHAIHVPDWCRSKYYPFSQSC